MLAGTIGSRPIGSPENARARQYIIEQLQLYGFTVRVQETDARRAELGRTAHLVNIVGVLNGARREAIGFLSHYDSSPDAPGGADDASGVAVSLEAARVLAARPDRRHSLMVLVTDGEEAGLMGAAALMGDKEVSDRLAAYLNFESIGASGTAELFETGPMNDWIVRPWAARAPHPRGGSYAMEIYRVLPNDTDFSILKRHDIPGLNFALIDDSYPYHTARDTADRVTNDALRSSGENYVATAEALDTEDLTVRSTSTPTFFDIGSRSAMSWGPAGSWIIAVLALVTGVLAWFKALSASVRLLGIGRWLLDLAWTIVGVAAVTEAMIGTTWALRHAREVYHPWYAHPDRLFVLLVAVGVLAGWAVVRLGRWIPARAHGPRHPLIVWSFALPLWIAAAGAVAALAPAAGYLWTLPLLSAGICLLVVPPGVPAVRAASVVVLAVSGTLWLNDTPSLLHFAVPVFGRLPFITPVSVYTILMLMCASTVAPPFIAIITETARAMRPSFVTAILMVIVAAAGGYAYVAEAYTHARPQHRHFRVIVPAGSTTATYEIASLEPGIDVEEGAPRGWTRVTDAPATPVAVGRFPYPFVFRTTAPSPGPAPAALTAFTLTSVAGGTELTMTVVPQAPGLTAVFELPPGVQPARSNLPGTPFAGRWRATFVAVPKEGVTWRASFHTGQEAKLPSSQVMIVSHRVPGGAGWQGVPEWLPQDRAVWSLDAGWVLAPGIAPVAPLR